jgi:hypothetical protein
MERHPYLLMIDWELDDEFEFGYQPDNSAYTEASWNIKTRQETTGITYEKHVSELLGLRHPYHKHLLWEQVPAELKADVMTSLKGHIPRQADITDCYPSPHKDRYAWRVTYWNKPPFLDPLRRWFPSYQKLAVPIIALWITDGIGNHPNLIGAQPGDQAYDFKEPKAINPNTLHVHDVVWSPHEDLLGYVISDVFYTMRVPK